MPLYPGTSLFPAGTAAPFPEDGGELAPGVTTGAAVVTGASTASLAGSINPNGLLAHYFFEYGFTQTYGSQSSTATTATTPVNVLLGVNIDGAAAYHYRLVAWNVIGTTYGSDREFAGLYAPVDPSFIHESGKGQY